jgi:hypothetical protein
MMFYYKDNEDWTFWTYFNDNATNRFKLFKIVKNWKIK